jgi:hypothetical protein
MFDNKKSENKSTQYALLVKYQQSEKTHKVQKLAQDTALQEMWQ